MKGFLVGLILGLGLGASAVWFLGVEKPDLQASKATAVASVERVTEAVREAMPDISVEDVREELEKGSVIVRERAKKIGGVIADSAADAKVSATLKAKFVRDGELPGFGIHVSSTDGVVTLSGKVRTHDEVAKAVKVALETEGVTKVFSTLQVEPAAQ